MKAYQFLLIALCLCFTCLFCSCEKEPITTIGGGPEVPDTENAKIGTENSDEVIEMYMENLAPQDSVDIVAKVYIKS